MKFSFKSKIKDLDREPEHLDDLKFILTTISDIKVMSLDTEVDITRVQERFRTINIYKLQVAPLFFYGTNGFN